MGGTPRRGTCHLARPQPQVVVVVRRGRAVSPRCAAGPRLEARGEPVRHRGPAPGPRPLLEGLAVRRELGAAVFSSPHRHVVSELPLRHGALADHPRGPLHDGALKGGVVDPRDSVVCFVRRRRRQRRNRPALPHTLGKAFPLGSRHQCARWNRGAIVAIVALIHLVPTFLRP